MKTTGLGRWFLSCGLRPLNDFLPEREPGLFQFTLMVLLVFDVILDSVLIEPDGGDEVTSVPERALREFLGVFFYPCGRLVFDDRNSV